MQLSEFLLHYRIFAEKFGWDLSPAGRLDKLKIEIQEFLEADTPENRKDEALDVLVCVIMYLIAIGVVNPLWAAFLKLERNAKRYLEGK